MDGVIKENILHQLNILCVYPLCLTDLLSQEWPPDESSRWKENPVITVTVQCHTLCIVQTCSHILPLYCFLFVLVVSLIRTLLVENYKFNDVVHVIIVTALLNNNMSLLWCHYRYKFTTRYFKRLSHIIEEPVHDCSCWCIQTEVHGNDA